MPSMRSLQRGALGALLVTTACAAAACGGSSGGGAAAATTGTTTAPPAAGAAAGGANGSAFATYTACLAKHGVTLPRFAGRPPGGGQGGGAPTGTTPAPPVATTPAGGQRPRGAFGSAAFRTAAAACADLRPKGVGGFRGGGFGGGQQRAAFAAYRNCLKLHGVTTLRGLGGATPSAKEQKAMSACASLRPARAPRPGSATTPTTATS